MSEYVTRGEHEAYKAEQQRKIAALEERIKQLSQKVENLSNQGYKQF